MAKRMQDKESIAGITWLALLIIAGWGGLVQVRAAAVRRGVGMARLLGPRSWVRGRGHPQTASDRSQGCGIK